MSSPEKKILGCGLGCGLISLVFIVLLSALLLGGLQIFLITLAATVLLSVIAILVKYVTNAPQRKLEAERFKKERAAREATLKAEASLRSGQITEGLTHFWRIRDMSRIKRCLSHEVKLPSRGLNDWWNSSEAPAFRSIIEKIFDNMVNIWVYVSLPANTFISQDIKNETWSQFTNIADYIRVIVHRL